MTFIVPLAFAITVPSALTSRLTGLRVLVTVGFTLALMVVTRLIWRAGLKPYGGASA